jgi:2-C-methyl-D-erythritol 4-phosphate cytidylyltransferase
MLGLIVITADTGAGLAPVALLEPLLGAPLLARGIAGALPTNEAVTGVLVVPADMIDRVKAEVVERFGLDEIDRVVAGGPDRKAAIAAGLAALPADVDVVLVQEGARVLTPVKLADAVVAAARTADAAIPGVAFKDTVGADEGGSLVALDVRPHRRALQGPAA